MSELPSNIQLIVDGVDISREDDLNLEITDVSPGGFDTLSYRLCNLSASTLTSSVVARDLTAVNADGSVGRTIYAGRVGDVDMGDDGYLITCKSQSVWTTDRRIKRDAQGSNQASTAIKYESGTRVMDIVRDSLSRLCPDIYMGDIVDSSLQLAENSPDFGGQSFADIISWATKLTSFLMTPLTWHVRSSGLLHYGVMDINFVDDSARLRVQYNKTFKSRFSDESFANVITVEWGGAGQSFTIPGDESGIQYDVIKMIREMYVNASNNVRLLNDAKALAYAYLTRFSQWRSVADSMTIDCSEGEKVIATMPIVGYPQEIQPWLVPTGYGCAIENIPKKWERYGTPNVKYLTSRKYNFATGKLDLGFGRPRSLSDQIEFMQLFEVNRPTAVADTLFGGARSAPLVDQDTTSVFGPSLSISTTVDPSLTTGIPMFATEGTVDGQQPINDGWLHPNIVADEGLEANFVVGDLTTVGYKGAIRIIPGRFNEIEVLLGDDDGLVQDSCFIKLWKLPKGFSTTPTFLTDIPLTQKRTLIQLPGIKEILLGRGDWILPQVVTASTAALWAAIDLHARRDYPDLKKA